LSQHRRALRTCCRCTHGHLSPSVFCRCSAELQVYGLVADHKLDTLNRTWRHVVLRDHGRCLVTHLCTGLLRSGSLLNAGSHWTPEQRVEMAHQLRGSARGYRETALVNVSSWKDADRCTEVAQFARLLAASKRTAGRETSRSFSCDAISILRCPATSHQGTGLAL